MSRGRLEGFTLIELSIVLVIIGLIVGGILTGQSLIAGAQVRTTITQIEKYNTATNTFRDKYGGLPGDLSVGLAIQFGFMLPTTCTGQQGGRDGNGLIDGYISPWVYAQGTGETALFWQDLGQSKLIDFSSGQIAANSQLTCNGATTSPTVTPGPNYLGSYLPVARIANNTFFYVYETGGSNWFGLSAMTSISVGAVPASNVSLPVSQAYSIDKKIDDGLPLTGNVVAVYLNGTDAGTGKPPNAATDSATTCYNTATAAGAYSISYNGGTGPNCALSFKFQAGD